jgi:hypothetical protein
VSKEHLKFPIEAAAWRLIQVAKGAKPILRERNELAFRFPTMPSRRIRKTMALDPSLPGFSDLCCSDWLGPANIHILRYSKKIPVELLQTNLAVAPFSKMIQEGMALVGEGAILVSFDPMGTLQQISEHWLTPWEMEFETSQVSDLCGHQTTHLA